MSRLKVIYMRRLICKLIFVLFVTFSSCNTSKIDKSDEELREIALEICQNNIILDSHIDWPEWVLDFPEDISERTLKGDFDLVRARQGGLNAALSVVFVSAKSGVDEGRIMVDSLIKLVTSYQENYPEKFALCNNPNDINPNFEKGLFSLILCLENGSPIGNDLQYLKFLKEQGIVYITLNHSKPNQISDSSYDTCRIWNGLSPFGYEVIREMNRLGIIIDISHSTDSAVFQCLRHSKAPIITSHSSCRYYTPGYERNLSDTLVKAIAAKRGVVMVNFGSQFLDSVCLKNWYTLLDWFDSTGNDELSEEGINYTLEFAKSHKLYAHSKQLVDHIDHVVKIAGIDYVGLGSDYDGLGYSLPTDLPDVSAYPVIVFELLKRGYSENEIEKILSGNFQRVWNEVLKIADS